MGYKMHNADSKKGLAKNKSTKQAKTRSSGRRVSRRRVEDEGDRKILHSGEEKYRQLFELESDALFMINKETTMM